MRRGVGGALLLVVLFFSGCFGRGAPEPQPGAIVAFGDSYTSGTGASTGEAYPARLSESLGVPVVNAGVHGETAAEARSRMQRDVLVHEPRLVIVEFGVNEAYRRHSVNDSIRNLDAIVGELRARDISVVLVGVHFAGFQDNFDEGLRGLAEKHGTGLVLDVLHGIVGDQRPGGDPGDPSLRSDEYHPNAVGYALMAERIRPEVERMLSSRSA